MFDLIYDFIYSYLFNTSVLTDAQKQNACVLITVVCIILIVFVLIKLIKWVFDFTLQRSRFKRW